MPRTKPSLPIFNGSHWQARGLMSAWPFFERGGTILRDVVSKNNMMLVGTGAAGRWRNSNVGVGLEGDPANAVYGEAPINLTLDTDPHTIVIVFRVQTINFAGGYALFSRGKDGAGAGWNIYLAVLPSNVAELSLVLDGAQRLATGTTSVVAGNVYSIVGTWEPGVGPKVYLNGKLEGSSSYAGLNLRQSTVGYVLYRVNTASYSDSIIFDARVYKRTWSARQVAAHHADPFALYRIDQHVTGKPPAGFYSRYYYDMAGGGAACSRT